MKEHESSLEHLNFRFLKFIQIKMFIRMGAMEEMGSKKVVVRGWGWGGKENWERMIKGYHPVIRQIGLRI